MRGRSAVLALAATLFLWNLWGYDVWAPDEPYFAEGAREMIVDGEWVVPHVNGVVTTDKPPVFFWLIALFSLSLGGEVSSFTARLPSVLAALGTLALTMRLGRRIAGDRAAILAGFVLATSYMFWEKARWGQIDSTLCFLIWVALSAFESFRAGNARGRPAAALFWSAMALAVLAKGPVGLLLPLAIAVITLAVDRDLGRWRRFGPLTGPACFALVAGAWIALTMTVGPAEYSVWGALREHFVDRGLHGMHHKQPFWYYLEVLPVYLLPWTGLVPGALLLAWRRRDAGDRLLLTAALFVVVFFSISTEKRELYALPAYPAFALLVARFATELFDEARARTAAIHPRWLTAGQTVVGALLVALGVALPFVARRFDEVPGWIPPVLAVILGVAGAVTLVALARGRKRTAVLAPGVGFVAAYLFAASALLPALDPVKSGRAFAERIREVAGASYAAGRPVLAYDLSNLPETFAFHTEGLYTIETRDPERLVAHLESDGTVFAVVHAPALESLPGDLAARVRVLDRTRLSRRDVLLIANR